MLPLIRLVLLIATSLLLTACDGDGDAGDAPEQLLSLQPMAVGDRRVYDVYLGEPLGGTAMTRQTVTITDTRRIGGVSTFVEETRDVFNNELLQQAHLEARGMALVEHFLPGELPFGADATTLTLLSLPLQEGSSRELQRWADADTGVDVDGDSINELVSGVMTQEVNTRETLTVPAGTFADALPVTTTLAVTYTYSASDTRVTTHFEVSRWLVAGIGEAKVVERTRYEGGLEQSEARLLTHYRVGGQRSESVAPTLLHVLPEDDEVDNAWPDFRFSFSEAMDLSRVAEIQLSVTDDTGAAVPGRGKLYGQYLDFEYTAPLASGTYTVRLSGAHDLVGNSLPPYTREITVDASTPGDTFNHFPINTGDRRVYNVNDSDIPGTYAVMETLTGETTVSGLLAQAVERRSPATYELLQRFYLSKTGAAVNEIYAPGTMPWGLPGNALVQLRLPLVEGDAYVLVDWEGIDIGRDDDGDGINETLDARTEATIGPVESVSVPVGNYNNARRIDIHARETFTSSLTGLQVEYSRHLRQWLVPGIGMVRREETLTADGQVRRITEDLAGYAVGGQRSHVYAPALSSFQPQHPGSNQTLAQINWRFHATLDIGTVDDADVTLFNGNGIAVPGRVEATESEIRFIPDTPLGEGNYTATLREVRDIYGNVTRNLTRTFVVDTTPLSVLASTPGDGARQIRTSSNIRVQFSEGLQYTSYGSPWVRLEANGVGHDLYNVVVNGADMTIIPRRLAHGTRYTLTLDARIADIVGNGLAAPYSTSFTTLPGLFADAPTHFATWAEVNATATGDINNDGRDDLVMVTGTSAHLSNVDANTLFIFRQKEDGTLAAPTRHTTSDGYGCAPSSVAVGDVTGDGRNDIVVGEGRCGIRVFEKDSNGNWPRPQRIVTVDSLLVAIDDLNGDGRADIVGSGGPGSFATVYFQSPAGGLMAPIVVGAGRGYATDMATGDTNGDGRRDIVIRYTDAVVTLPALPGGSFGTASTRMTDDGRGVAVGDINSDGRDDVLFTINGNTPRARIAVLYQQADGTLGEPVTRTSYDIPTDIAVGDIDGDDRNDVLVTHTAYSAIGVYLQADDGTLVAEDIYVADTNSHSTQVLSLGDLDNDGDLDAVTGDSRHMDRLENVSR